MNETIELNPWENNEQTTRTQHKAMVGKYGLLVKRETVPKLPGRKYVRMGNAVRVTIP